MQKLLRKVHARNPREGRGAMLVVHREVSGTAEKTPWDIVCAEGLQLSSHQMSDLVAVHLTAPEGEQPGFI